MTFILALYWFVKYDKEDERRDSSGQRLGFSFEGGAAKNASKSLYDIQYIPIFIGCFGVFYWKVIFSATEVVKGNAKAAGIVRVFNILFCYWLFIMTCFLLYTYLEMQLDVRSFLDITALLGFS